MRRGFFVSRHEREPEARDALSKATAVVDNMAAPMSMHREPERRFSAAEHEIFVALLLRYLSSQVKLQCYISAATRSGSRGTL